MQYNVAQLLKESGGSKRNYEVDYSPEERGFNQPVSGKVEFIHTNRSILVRGTLTTETELVCSRCLISFKYPLTINLEEEFFSAIDVGSGIEVSIPNDVEGFTIDKHHILDLTEAVRQYTLLNTPMSPVCKPDCAGLCPQCGKNLNQCPCQCKI